jgi:hypothetical protein
LRRERPVVQPTVRAHGGDSNELFDGLPRRAARAFINFVPHGYEGKGPRQVLSAPGLKSGLRSWLIGRKCGQRGEPQMHLQPSSRQGDTPPKKQTRGQALSMRKAPWACRKSLRFRNRTRTDRDVGQIDGLLRRRLRLPIPVDNQFEQTHPVRLGRSVMKASIVACASASSEQHRKRYLAEFDYSWDR